LKIAVYQGERDLIEHNRKLGEFILKGIPPMAAGLPKIEIQFLLNADGILKVKAIEERSGVEQEIEVKPQYGISDEEMAKMLLDSIKNAQDDMNIRALLEARNEANVLLVSVDRFLNQHKALFTDEEIDATLEFAAQLRHAVEGDDKDKINQTMAALNEYTAPLAHKAMDETIAGAMKGQKI
jgi:molecular chaperone HscA